MPRRVTVVLNSATGPLEGRSCSSGQIADLMRAAGLEPQIVIAAGRDVAAAAQCAVQRGEAHIIAGGGDGTVSAVASALAGTQAVLGVLPLGTLNHFAKDLHIPLEIEAAVRTIAAGHVIALDLAEVNGRPFINNSSLGAYPSMIWDRERQRRRGRAKWLALAAAVVRVWSRFRRVRVVLALDGQRRTVRTPFVFIGNNEYHLEGVKIGARASLDRGCLHLCMAPGMTRLGVARVMLAALAARLSGVEYFESLCPTDLTIEARRRRLPVSLDGELTILDTPLHYRIRPRALRVLVPAQA